MPDPQFKRRLKVLIVDDLEPNHKLLSKYFEMMGIDGDHAYNGQQAVDKVGANVYDLILMDFQMPEMDGVSATQIIRVQIKSQIPIIALTGSASQDELDLGLNVGMDDYIRKPVTLTELREKILQYVPE